MAGALERMHQVIEGDVIRRGDPVYEEARRVWNGAVDRRPDAIVRCAVVSDFRHNQYIEPAGEGIRPPCTTGAVDGSPSSTR